MRILPCRRRPVGGQRGNPFTVLLVVAVVPMFGVVGLVLVLVLSGWGW